MTNKIDPKVKERCVSLLREYQGECSSRTHGTPLGEYEVSARTRTAYPRPLLQRRFRRQG